MGRKCLRCGNENPDFFGNDHGILYCRKCIDFGRLNLGERDRRPVLKKFSHNRSKTCKGAAKDLLLHTEPVLEFELTGFQKSISEKALRALREGKDVFIYAAAGAGKTEITLQSIAWYLNHKKSVCFAISRRQVVLEIAKRLRSNFPDLKISAVCEGYPEHFEDRFDSDLIVCTMHQLYQYPDCFDLLIMDEVDAFPYAGNQVLESIAERACRGQKMMLSATPDKKSLEAIEQGEMVLCELFRRPHGKPLCIPEIRRGSHLSQVIQIFMKCRRLVQTEKLILVFVPRKADGWWMKTVLGWLAPSEFIHSGIDNKDQIMEQFRKQKTKILVTTTLLERGITVPDVQVLVYRSDHPVFTCASLIQIFGRVGRTFSNPYGEGICFCERISSSMKECITILERMNKACSQP